jgi:hypothetical protein
MARVKVALRLLGTCATVLSLTGCAGTYAAEGAKSGLVGGAVAGAVASAFTGGNVGANIVAGAATTAAAGAAVGAMTPKQDPQQSAASPPATDKGNLKSTDPKLIERERELERRIGPENFDAARMLAFCRHDRAIEQARKAFTAADTPERRQYALMLEAITAEEKGDKATANAVYPKMLEIDPTLGTTDKARSDALSGILKVQQVRQEYGLAPTCPS